MSLKITFYLQCALYSVLITKWFVAGIIFFYTERLKISVVKVKREC